MKIAWFNYKKTWKIDAQDEANDAQRGAITMFDEQKRYESHIQKLQSNVHRANTAMDKMRDEAVHLRSKNNDLRDDDAAGQTVLTDRDFTIEDLRSLLEIRNQELDGLEQSVATSQEERTRLQLHSNEMTVSMVSLRQELEDARTVLITARASDGRAASSDPDYRGTPSPSGDAQALLRTTQEQQQQYMLMPPPSTHPTRTGGTIGNTPFVPPFSTPSTGLRARELHGPVYYHIGSPADPGCDTTTMMVCSEN